MAFRITWDKYENTFTNRYTPVVSESLIIGKENILGYSLYATISESHYKIEAQRNGMYGDLYPKLLIEEAQVSSLLIAKKKVRFKFKELCHVYNK